MRGRTPPPAAPGPTSVLDLLFDGGIGNARDGDDAHRGLDGAGAPNQSQQALAVQPDIGDQQVEGEGIEEPTPARHVGSAGGPVSEVA